MKQITLTDRNFRTLQACLKFCADDVEETGRALDELRVFDEQRIDELRAAVAICTRTVEQ